MKQVCFKKQCIVVVCILLIVTLVRLLYKQSRFYYNEPVLTVGALQFQDRVIVIKSGQLFQLRLNWLNHRVKYKSENTLIVSVNSAGKLFGLKPGKTVVTGTSGDKTAKSKIYVISFQETMVLKNGASKRIQVNGKLTNITYRSSNTGIATVSRFGRVTGRAKGITNITFTIHGYSFQVKVTVK